MATAAEIVAYCNIRAALPPTLPRVHRFQWLISLRLKLDFFAADLDFSNSVLYSAGIPL